MTTQNTNFLGIPVKGDITGSERRTEQKPLSELEPLIRAVLDDPTMKAFGWTQYTPYFNDGDPCVFNVHEPWFLTVGDPDPDEIDTYSYELSSYGDGHPSIGKQVLVYEGSWPNRELVSKTYTGPDEERFNRVSALGAAIEGGAFDDVLLEAFGDHANVVVRATGITVDFYSHD